jgi:hypothetical protein
MEDKRNRSDEQQSGQPPREPRRRDRRSGGSMEAPGSQRSPREDEEQPQE